MATILELTNATEQILLPEETLNLGNVTFSRNFNGVFYNNNNSIVINRPGTYWVYIKTDAKAAIDMQEMKVSLFGNDTESALANTVATATMANEKYTIQILKLIVVRNAPLVISFKNTGTDKTVFSETIVTLGV